LLLDFSRVFTDGHAQRDRYWVLGIRKDQDIEHSTHEEAGLSRAAISQLLRAFQIPTRLF
jgi:hypothetical protein